MIRGFLFACEIRGEGVSSSAARAALQFIIRQSAGTANSDSRRALAMPPVED
jgi:hypothetical protein